MRNQFKKGLAQFYQSLKSAPAAPGLPPLPPDDDGIIDLTKVVHCPGQPKTVKEYYFDPAFFIVDYRKEMKNVIL